MKSTRPGAHQYPLTYDAHTDRHIFNRTVLKTYTNISNQRLISRDNHYNSWNCMAQMFSEHLRSQTINERRLRICMCACQLCIEVLYLWSANVSIHIRSRSSSLARANSLLLVQLYMRSHRLLFLIFYTWFIERKKKSLLITDKKREIIELNLYGISICVCV